MTLSREISSRQYLIFKLGMAKGLKVGAKVSGVANAVLKKGEYSPVEANATIYGVVTGFEGDGCQRKWFVQWRGTGKSSVVPARRVAACSTDSDGSEIGDDDDSDSEGNSSDDSADLQPTDAPTVDAATGKVVVHGLEWTRVQNVSVNQFVGPRRKCLLSWGNDLPLTSRREIDFFLLLFPTEAADAAEKFTTEILEVGGLPALTRGEFYKFLGLMYAMCVVDFGERRHYWKEGSNGLFEYPAFGRVMSRDRFEAILRCLRFASPSEDGDKWRQPRSFVDFFNKCRSERVQPSSSLTVDEKMSAYRPVKGAWCDDSIPHLTKIVRKPEGVGTELKDCSDGTTCIALRLEIQEGAEVMSTKEFTDRYNAGTSLYMRLTQP